MAKKQRQAIKRPDRVVIMPFDNDGSNIIQLSKALSMASTIGCCKSNENKRFRVI